MPTAYHGPVVPPRPADLPSYDRPPVTEVVLSLQFGSLTELRSYQMGWLYELASSRYPTLTEQPPIEPQFEIFGAPAAPQSPRITFEPMAVLPMPRFWFEAPDSSLMQVQQDRLIHNWRKRDTTPDYPRYEKLRAEFTQDIDTFTRFLDDRHLGRMQINQVEISYLNTIVLPDGANPHQALERIVTNWNARALSVGGEPELAGWNAQYLLKKDDQTMARMRVNVFPAVRASDQAPVARMDLTVRGKPADETIASGLEFMDQGREAIVRSFTDLTTEEMHKVWGRTQ